jgi:hypothetical protein
MYRIICIYASMYMYVINDIKSIYAFLVYRKEAEVKKPKDKKQSGSGEATGATEEGEGEEVL